MVSATLRPFKARSLLIISSVLTMLAACQPHDQKGEAESFVEGGKLWAYGSVQLSRMELPGLLMLKRRAAVQSLDSAPPQSTSPEPFNPGYDPATRPPSPANPAGNSAYALYGAVNAATGASGERDLAYVDWHASRAKRLLAYTWQLDYEVRRGQPDTVHIFALLKKPSLSFKRLHRIPIGSARFEKNASFATVNMASGLKLSQIADGVLSGQWAMHYADAPLISTQSWQGICPQNYAQLPGQNVSQNPGQYDSCKPLPSTYDLCEGDPTRESCRPRPPVQRPYDRGGVPGGEPQVVLPSYDVTNLDVLSEKDRVYALSTDSDAKIVFTSASVSVQDEQDNAEACASRFMAVGRTLGRQVNDACVLKASPSSPVDGKMSCALTVSFQRAETYLEKICDITAIFRNGDLASSETQAVQVLKR